MENVKPAATLKERVEQTVSRGGLLKHFSRVQGNFGEELASGGREDKIKHVWYFWASEANSSLCAAIVRIKLSSVNQACNKILGILAWLQWLKIALEEETRRHWWHMRMPCILLDAWLTKLSSILTMAAHSEEFALLVQNYQTCLVLFPPSCTFISQASQKTIVTYAKWQATNYSQALMPSAHPS